MFDPHGKSENQPKKTRRSRNAIILIAGALIIGMVILFFGMPAPVPHQDTLQSLVIASGSPEYSTLTLIADEKGFFTQYGLNVTLKDYPTGVGAVRDLLSGESDLAAAAEFVGVVLLDTSPELKIIGCTAKSDVISLVIRNDRGIISPKDLKGKIIAVPEGTQAEFFLGRYLELNGVPLSGVTIRYLSPDDLVTGIIAGEVDGVVIWEPYVYSIQQQMKTNATTWPAQSGQLFYWVTYTRDDVIREKPGQLIRYFQAISDAEQYLIHNDAEARAVVNRQVNLSDEYTDMLFEKTQFTLSLDQSMIIAMEDEERWRMNNNLTDTSAIPNYLNSISTEILRTVRSESVNFIG